MRNQRSEIGDQVSGAGGLKTAENQSRQPRADSKINYSLDNITKALAFFDNPQSKLKFIHIAGTNGKGSTADFIAQHLEHFGYKVGLYSSPHLISYTERYLINGNPISYVVFENYYESVQRQIEKINLTEFEILTVIGLLYFIDQQVEYVVWETGLGGRLDATNVVNPEVSVITSISKDHAAYLGNKIEQIAQEKAGIIKRSIPVFIQKQEYEIEDIVKAVATEKKAPINIIDYRDENYLKQNAILASEVVKHLLPKRKDNINLISSKLNTRLKCRLQVLRDEPLVLLDAAHNIGGIEKLIKYLGDSAQDTVFFYGATKRPELDIIVKMLAENSKKLFFCEFKHDRAVALSEFMDVSAEFKNKVGSIGKFAVKEEINKAIRRKQSAICVTGSIYFLGEILRSIKVLSA